MKKVPAIGSYVLVLACTLLFAACEGDSTKGSEVDLSALKKFYTDSLSPRIRSLRPDDARSRDIGGGIATAKPTNIGELPYVVSVVRNVDGRVSAGFSVPIFNTSLTRDQQVMDVYSFLGLPVKEGNDTIIYGVGYSIHYFYKKLAKGISAQNLAQVAASVQLNSSKTEVFYAVSGFGMNGRAINSFFKPVVNKPFDVNGYGILQTHIDGITTILSDSTVFSKVTFTPVPVNIKYKEFMKAVSF